MASLALTPRRHLLFTAEDGTFQPPPELLRRLDRAFARGSGHGLLELGAAEVGTTLPADFGYWRDFAVRLVTTVCTHPDSEAPHAKIPAPAIEELEAAGVIVRVPTAWRPIDHHARKSRPPSEASRRRVSARTRSSTSRWASASTANR